MTEKLEMGIQCGHAVPNWFWPGRPHVGPDRRLIFQPRPLSGGGVGGGGGALARSRTTSVSDVSLEGSGHVRCLELLWPRNPV